MESKTATRKLIRDYVVTIVTAVITALFLRTYVIEAYQLPSSAMSPTLLAGDTLFVEKWPIVLNQYTPKRGDIIIFSDQDETHLIKLDYIKRVIGLPGDSISLKGGNVILNGKNLSKGKDSLEVLPNGKNYSVSITSPPPEDFGPETVPEHSAFVIGDLRSNISPSAKSLSERKFKKIWEIIPFNSIKGKARWIWLSVDPKQDPEHLSWIPHFRFERMFRSIH